MTRREKIQLLQAIKAGSTTPGSLQGVRYYLFIECLGEPGMYLLDGIKYTEAQRAAKCDQIRTREPNSVIWVSMRNIPDSGEYTMSYSIGM